MTGKVVGAGAGVVEVTVVQVKRLVGPTTVPAKGHGGVPCSVQI